MKVPMAFEKERTYVGSEIKRSERRITMVSESGGLFRFTACPWGEDVFKLLLIYDSKSKEGMYALQPRFNYGGRIVAPRSVKDDKLLKLSVLTKYFENISLDDFLHVMNGSVDMSVLNRGENGEFELVFRQHKLCRRNNAVGVEFYCDGVLVSKYMGTLKDYVVTHISDTDIGFCVGIAVEV